MFNVIGGIYDYWNESFQANQPSELSIGSTPALPRERNVFPLNELSASWASFFSRLLVERTFFQNQAFPKEIILYLANDLINILSPKKPNYLSLTKECTIFWKQIKGCPLTPEEEHYENSSKSIDVTGEILNGLSLSMTALIGQNFCSSIHSTVSQRLWGHVPSIIGYFSVTLLGSQGIALAVDQLIQKTELSQEQKELIKPWLNMLGRLILGFVPKVHANEKGVHYHYPSFEGHSQTSVKGQSTTMKGDFIHIEKEGVIETPEGDFYATYSAGFKLNKIEELNEEKISFQVTTEEGKVVPILFQRVDGVYGPEIQVICDDEKMADHWTKLIYPKNAVVKKESDCSLEISLALAGSVAMQSVLPLAIASLSCIKPAYATEAITPGQKNLHKFSSFIHQKLTFSEAEQRYKILLDKEEENTLSNEDKRELSQLEELFKDEVCKIDEKVIQRNQGGKWYKVVCKESKEVALFKQFNTIESRTSIILHNPSNTLAEELILRTGSFNFIQVLHEVESVMGAEFIYTLQYSYKANFLLLYAASFLYSYNKIFSSLIRLISKSDNLYLLQKDFINNSSRLITNYVKDAQNTLQNMMNKINANALQTLSGKTYSPINEAQLQQLQNDVLGESKLALRLVEKIEPSIRNFSSQVETVKEDIQKIIHEITKESSSITTALGKIDELLVKKAELEKVKISVKESEEDWFKKRQKEVDSIREEKHQVAIGEFKLEWNTYKQDDFKSNEAWTHFKKVRSQLEGLNKEIFDAEQNLALEISHHLQGGDGSKDTKENLNKASQKLAASFVNIQTLDMAIKRKIDQVVKQKNLIQNQISDYLLKIDTIESAFYFIEELGNKVLSFRYMLNACQFQISAINEITLKELEIVRSLSSDLTTGTNKLMELEKEIEKNTQHLKFPAITATKKNEKDDL